MYWSFSISPSNEYSGLIFFKIVWFDLFAAQGTLKSLLQHHGSEASILWHLAFFIVIFPGGSDGKASVYNAYHMGDPASIPGLGRSQTISL